MAAPSMLPDAAVTVSFALPVSQAEFSERLDLAIKEEAARLMQKREDEDKAITIEEAARLAAWTVNGFRRVAVRENCPAIKGAHKSPTTYLRSDVMTMLRRMRVWPHGRPVEEAPTKLRSVA